MLFLLLVFVFNFDLFKFSAVILDKGLFVCTELFLFVVKQGTPTPDELERLSAFIGKDWMTFGRCLGVRDENLDEIDQHPNLQIREKGYRMLKRWSQKNGFDATYKALCDGLLHDLVERKDLAETFCYINGNYFPQY